MPDASENNNRRTLDEDPKVVAKLQVIRELVTKRLAMPAPSRPDRSLPPLDPLKQASVLAAHLSGAIGTLNPRPAGAINHLLQRGKRFLARLMEWQVRPQREFNRAVADSLAHTVVAIEATRLTVGDATQYSAEIQKALREEVELLTLQVDSLRELLDEKLKLQRWAYDGVLARQSTALQDRVYELLGDVQKQVGARIGALEEEVRIVRQRLAAQTMAEGARLTSTTPAVVSGSAKASRVGIDYFQLERHFRGAEEEIRARQSFYLPFFEGRQNVLDIACGRGEFLELMREAKVNARGVDLDTDMVGRCLEKGLNVVQSDVFAYLATVPEASLDGIFCSQFVEHLAPESYVRLVALCGEKLSPSGILAVETQNPECLAIFSQNFYLDPTHVKPVPPGLLRVLFAEAGLERVSTHSLSPAAQTLPVIPELASRQIEADALEAWNHAIRRFNDTFFGGMDYAIIGYRRGSLRTDSGVGVGP